MGLASRFGRCSSPRLLQWLLWECGWEASITSIYRQFWLNLPLNWAHSGPQQLDQTPMRVTRIYVSYLSLVSIYSRSIFRPPLRLRQILGLGAALLAPKPPPSRVQMSGARPRSSRGMGRKASTEAASKCMNRLRPRHDTPHWQVCALRAVGYSQASTQGVGAGWVHVVRLGLEALGMALL